MKDTIVIGTRGSMLALWQAGWVKSLIEKERPGLKVELMKIKTTGDKIQDVPLAKVGGKGLFVKEIEEAMMRGEIDLAVHSMKDVPTFLPEGLHLSALLKREDPRDALVSHRGEKFANLPKGAAIGTSSLRRSCQLLAIRPDLKVEMLRGNLDTRLKKAEEGAFDAVILAAAGINRLGWASRITELLSPEVCLPAIAQGAVGIECRVDDEFTNELLKPLRHHETTVCVTAERAALTRLEGGCQVPIAGHARLKGGTLSFSGLVGNLTGEVIIRASGTSEEAGAEALGIRVAEELLSKGADRILSEVYGQQQ